jgi:hypothetical protein
MAECVRDMFDLAGAEPRSGASVDARDEASVQGFLRSESGGEGGEQDQTRGKCRLRSSVRNQQDSRQLGGPHHHLELRRAETR